jgi:hypothetical protein
MVIHLLMETIQIKPHKIGAPVVRRDHTFFPAQNFIPEPDGYASDTVFTYSILRFVILHIHQTLLKYKHIIAQLCRESRLREIVRATFRVADWLDYSLVYYRLHAVASTVIMKKTNRIKTTGLV